MKQSLPESPSFFLSHENHEGACDILFVLYDAGETKALLPVIQELGRCGTSCGILANTTAKRLLQDTLCFTEHSAAICQTYSIRLVMTGLASQFQRKQAAFHKNRGIPVVGYYDSFFFSPNANHTINFKNLLTALIVPSKDIARLLKPTFPNIPVLALGQPTLESIPHVIRQSHPAALYATLHLDPGKTICMFAGSYGPGYAEAFTRFCQGFKSLPDATHSQLNLLLSLHPKTDGTLENSILSQHALHHIVRTVPKSITTDRVLSITDIVLSYNSVMALQALFQGKQILLPGDPADPDEFNPLVTYCGAVRLQSAEACSYALNAAISRFKPTLSNGINRGVNWHSILGIPRHATRNISRYLTQFLLEYPYEYAGNIPKNT